MITIFNRESLWIGRDMKRDGWAMARPVEALEAWEVRLILCMSMKSLF